MISFFSTLRFGADKSLSTTVEETIDIEHLDINIDFVDSRALIDENLVNTHSFVLLNFGTDIYC